jgi:phosphoribosylglycinamide formyltransferase-1
VSEDRRLARLTKVSLALPEAERELVGRHGRFHVRGKTFAWYLDDHHGDGIVSVSCKMALGENREVAALDPARFYLPAYMAHRGWIAMRLDAGKIDWNEVGELVAESYRLIAPRRLGSRVSRRESLPLR